MNTEKKKSPMCKALSITLDVLTYLFFAVCIFALINSVISKKNSDGAMSFFGKQMRIVTTDSMGEYEGTDVSGYDIKSIPVKSLVFIELVPEDEAEAEKWYSELKKGDVLTFKYVYTTQVTITHRIVKEPVKKSDGGYLIELEGDNKNSNTDTLSQLIDTSIEDSPNYIIGKVTSQSYAAGVIISAVKSPVGLICIVIIPSLIIMVFEIFRLVNVLTEKRRKAEREEQQKRDEEFEEMRRQLELLKKQSDQSSGDNSSSANTSNEEK